MEKRPIQPIVPGFRFKCVRCGNCCIKQNRLLSLDELAYFRTLGINPIRYVITTRKKDDRILATYPCKPPNHPCIALEIDTNNCLIYRRRPAVCKTFPFIMRIYYKRPPTIDEINQSFRIEKQGYITTKLKPYIIKISKQRWVFFGFRDMGEGFCKGAGQGKPWTKHDIKRYVVEHIFIYENSKELLSETNRILQDHLLIFTKEDINKYFKYIQNIYSDDESEMNLYEAINRSPNIVLGNWKLKEPFPSENIKLKTDFGT